MITQQYLSRRFDEAAILSTLAKVAFSSDPSLEEGDFSVMAALRRSSPDWDLSLAETSERLASYSDDQIDGLVNNVKGILHEMEFQRLENDDGDSVLAALFPNTNHRSVDVQLHDQATGATWDIQLKATDNVSAIADWMASNPETEILVTEELAEKMGLPSSGISNEDLTVRVGDFVDRMVKQAEEEGDTLGDYFPLLVTASAGIIIFELWRRYRTGNISLAQFKTLTLKTLGLKAAKYGAFFLMLAVPGLNIVVGAYLLGSLIFAVDGIVDKATVLRPFAPSAP